MRNFELKGVIGVSQTGIECAVCKKRARVLVLWCIDMGFGRLHVLFVRQWKVILQKNTASLPKYLGLLSVSRLARLAGRLSREVVMESCSNQRCGFLAFACTFYNRSCI